MFNNQCSSWKQLLYVELLSLTVEMSRKQ